jgi:hypothetical protein
VRNQNAIHHPCATTRANVNLPSPDVSIPGKYGYGRLTVRSGNHLNIFHLRIIIEDLFRFALIYVRWAREEKEI